MSAWVYVHSETTPEGFHVYTVGHYSPRGEWHPDGDYNTREEAAMRCNYLNGAGASHSPGAHKAKGSTT